LITCATPIGLQSAVEGRIPPQMAASPFGIAPPCRRCFPAILNFYKEARLSPGPFGLLLLLALGVSLLAVLAGILRVLLGARGVLLALCVVILAVVLGGSAMRFGGILVVLGRLIVLVFGH
jgi:hypothetical protein